MTLVSLKKKEGLLYPENRPCSLLHWSLQGANSRFPSSTSAKTPGILASLSNSGSQIPSQSGHRVHGQFFHGKPLSCTLWGEKLELEAVLGPDTCHLYCHKVSSSKTGCSFCSWDSFAICLWSAFVSGPPSLNTLDFISTFQ